MGSFAFQHSAGGVVEAAGGSRVLLIRTHGR